VGITEDEIYNTVVNQVEILKKHHLKGTFLLQYDALMNSRYQQLLKSLPSDSFEIGAWWEIPQPLVENAGMVWRGRYPWDWHANVGFATGYTPAERKKLVDVYMKDFKKIFGYYPKSVGSWFIDAHTLNYMYKKYNIVASCNCKDQIGTDGYTMWGGYWNQAYYPSVNNSFMPAQNIENEIPVPIFRMLGSDPVRQYGEKTRENGQGVITMEPVYPGGGGDSTWVNWYFKEFLEEESLEYAYVQVGQENSFTWKKMEKGLRIQIPIIEKLKNEKKVQVQTLSESGRWFRRHYKTTPATSVTVSKDLEGSNCKTVWFNSRYYRFNLYWKDDILKFRDIHLFNENLASDYLTKNGISSQCQYFTIPFVDGYQWSTAEQTAGLYFKIDKDGKTSLLKGGTPVFTNPVPGTLKICWPLSDENGTLIITADEKQIKITRKGNTFLKWFLDLNTAEKVKLPFREITDSRITGQFKGINFSVSATKGTFSKRKGTIFRIFPEKNGLSMNMKK